MRVRTERPRTPVALLNIAQSRTPLLQIIYRSLMVNIMSCFNIFYKQSGVLNLNLTNILSRSLIIIEITVEFTYDQIVFETHFW